MTVASARDTWYDKSTSFVPSPSSMAVLKATYFGLCCMSVFHLPPLKINERKNGKKPDFVALIFISISLHF